MQGYSFRRFYAHAKHAPIQILSRHINITGNPACKWGVSRGSELSPSTNNSSRRAGANARDHVGSTSTLRRLGSSEPSPFKGGPRVRCALSSATSHGIPSGGPAPPSACIEPVCRWGATCACVADASSAFPLCDRRRLSVQRRSPTAVQAGFRLRCEPWRVHSFCDGFPPQRATWKPVCR